MATKLSFADQIRKCIDGSGMTRYAIGVAADIDHSTISRFMNAKGNAGLSMDALNAVADVIGMRAVLDQQGRKGGK